MQSFKAANPGCAIEDFIRWHSPKDWLVDEHKTEKDGYLSERMKDKDNVWHMLWSDATPIAGASLRDL